MLLFNPTYLKDSENQGYSFSTMYSTRHKHYLYQNFIFDQTQFGLVTKYYFCLIICESRLQFNYVARPNVLCIW